MSEGYFSPWEGISERDCRTCRYSVGQPSGVHLWFEQHQLVVVFPCGVVGAVDPEFRTSTDRSDRRDALLPAVCADFTALSIQDRAIARGQRYRRSQIKFATSPTQRTISPYIRSFPLRRSTITI